MNTNHTRPNNPHIDPSTVRKKPGRGSFKQILAPLVLAATTVTVLCQSLSAVTDLIVRWTS